MRGAAQLTSILNDEAAFCNGLSSLDPPPSVWGQEHLHLRRLQLVEGPVSTTQTLPQLCKLLRIRKLRTKQTRNSR